MYLFFVCGIIYITFSNKLFTCANVINFISFKKNKKVSLDKKKIFQRSDFSILIDTVVKKDWDRNYAHIFYVYIKIQSPQRKHLLIDLMRTLNDISILKSSKWGWINSLKIIILKWKRWVHRKRIKIFALIFCKVVMVE